MILNLELIIVLVGLACLFYFFQRQMSLLNRQMSDRFKALSFDVLEQNGKQFLHLADAALKPIQESMKGLDEQQRQLEQRREGAYSAISKQIEGLLHSEKELRMETTR